MSAAGTHQRARIVLAMGKLADTRTGELPTDVLPIHDRFFGPGERTRDRGELGDPSLETIIPLSTLFQAFSRTVLPPPASVQVHLELRSAANLLVHQLGPFLLEPNSTRRFVLKGLQGGTYRLRFVPTRDGLPTLGALIAVPPPVRVHLDRRSLARDMPGEWRDTHKQQEIDAIEGVARRVAGHALRALNVRLYFPPDTLPDHFGPSEWLPRDPFFGPPVPPDDIEVLLYEPGQAAPTRPMQILVGGRGLGWEPDDTMPDGTTNGLDVLRSADEPALAGAIREALREDAPVASVDGWGCDARFLDFGLMQVNAFAGKVVQGEAGVRSEVEPVLEAARSWTAPARLAGMYAELAGRALGIQVARSVVRLLGLDLACALESITLPHVTHEPEEPSDDSHDDLVEAIPARVQSHTQLVDAAPAEPLKDLLGLERPSGDWMVTQLEEGLLAQHRGAQAGQTERQRRAAWIAGAGQWRDLCGLHGWHRGLWSDQDKVDTGPYDVLAGLFEGRVLEIASLAAPLPLPYHGLCFREGDRDASGNTAARYENAAPPAGAPSDLIAQVQKDLTAIGLHWGHSVRGLWGYLHFRTGAGTAHYNGVRAGASVAVGADDRPRLKAGHTALAMREFAVMCDMPCQLFERLDGEPVYANRLFPEPGLDLAGRTNETLAAGASAEQGVNGRMEPRAAFLLQQARFGRRRHPATVEFWVLPPAQQNHAIHHDQEPSGLFAENAVGPDDVTDAAVNAYGIDRSGLFAAPSRRRRRLGRYSRGGWRGPVGASTQHSVAEPSWANSMPGFDVPADEDEAADVRYLMRLVSGVLQVESGGFLDGYNAWDDAVFSLPPFHPTIARGNGDVPGQMGTVVNFFQRPPRQVIEAAVPMPPGPITDEVREGVEARRRSAVRALRAIWYRAYGRFGVGVGWSSDRHRDDARGDEYRSEDIAAMDFASDGFITLPPFGKSDLKDSAGDALPSMDADWVVPRANYNRQRALYQSYTQWFRTWPWVHRFVNGVRANDDIRLGTTMFMLEFARRTFQKARNDGIAGHFDGSDWTASYILRAHVRGPDRYTLARNAIRDRNFATEAARRQAISVATGGVRYPNQTAPHADFGGRFTDTAHPSGTDLEDAFEALLHKLVLLHAPEPPGPLPPDADGIQNRLWLWLGAQP